MQDILATAVDTKDSTITTVIKDTYAEGTEEAPNTCIVTATFNNYVYNGGTEDDKTDDITVKSGVVELTFKPLTKLINEQPNPADDGSGNITFKTRGIEIKTTTDFSITDANGTNSFSIQNIALDLEGDNPEGTEPDAGKSVIVYNDNTIDAEKKALYVDESTLIQSIFGSFVTVNDMELSGADILGGAI